MDSNSNHIYFFLAPISFDLFFSAIACYLRRRNSSVMCKKCVVDLVVVGFDTTTHGQMNALNMNDCVMRNFVVRIKFGVADTSNKSSERL